MATAGAPRRPSAAMAPTILFLVMHAWTRPAHEDHTGCPATAGAIRQDDVYGSVSMALEPSVVTVTGPDRAALLTDLTLRFGHIELVSEREIVLQGGGRGHELTVRHRPFTSELGGVVAAVPPPAPVHAVPEPPPAPPAPAEVPAAVPAAEPAAGPAKGPAEAAVAPPPAPDADPLHAEAQRALAEAREQAEALLAEAREQAQQALDQGRADAEQLRADARDEAARVAATAEEQKAAALAHARAEAQEELAAARAAYEAQLAEAAAG